MSGPLEHHNRRNNGGGSAVPDPCGGGRGGGGSPGDGDEFDSAPGSPPRQPPRSTADLLQPLLIASTNALTKAQHFSTEWVHKTFHSPVRDHHSLWNQHSLWNSHYDWLPSKEEIPKSLGENLSPEVLKAIENKSLDSTLKVIFRNLQIYAVGLEHAHEDQKQYKDGWDHHFLSLQNENKAVLCELSSVLWEIDEAQVLEDVARDALADVYKKDSSSSSRNLRDWFILRDFMTTLEYLIEVCTYFSKRSLSE